MTIPSDGPARGPHNASSPERKLEARRGRPAEDSAARGTAFEPGAEPRRVAAIYLIEREAIRLRRLRWQADPGAAADDALKLYARPPPDASAEPTTVSGKIGRGLRRIFGLRDKGRA
jgi:hypothetical protein